MTSRPGHRYELRIYFTQIKLFSFIVIIIPVFISLFQEKNVSKNIKGVVIMTGKREVFEGLKKPLTLPIGGIWTVGPPTSGVTQSPPVILNPCEYT